MGSSAGRVRVDCMVREGEKERVMGDGGREGARYVEGASERESERRSGRN